MRRKTSSTVYEAPRWAGVASWLKDEAFLAGLELHIEVEKGWMRERGRFRVTGRPEDVDDFMDLFDRTGRAYNARLAKKS
jgi:hypothetical protein